MEETIMGFYADTKANIQYTDSDGTTYYNIGDEVVCYTDKIRYMGRIAQVGTYQNEQRTESFPAIYIDTSMRDKSISGEIVLMKDIKHIHKIVSGEIERQIKEGFVEMLQNTGYKKEFSENIFDRLYRVIYGHNITMSKIIVCIDSAIENHCSVEEVLKQMCNVDERGIESELLKVKEECSNIMKETCKGFLTVFWDLMENRKKDNLTADKA